MVSLKSFLSYFSQPRPPVPLNQVEQQQIEHLIQAFGGEANIINVDACISGKNTTLKFPVISTVGDIVDITSHYVVSLIRKYR